MFAGAATGAGAPLTPNNSNKGFDIKTTTPQTPRAVGGGVGVGFAQPRSRGVKSAETIYLLYSLYDDFRRGNVQVYTYVPRHEERSNESKIMCNVDTPTLALSVELDNVQAYIKVQCLVDENGEATRLSHLFGLPTPADALRLSPMIGLRARELVHSLKSVNVLCDRHARPPAPSRAGGARAQTNAAFLGYLRKDIDRGAPVPLFTNARWGYSRVMYSDAVGISPIRFRVDGRERTHARCQNLEITYGSLFSF
ncbi:hypothetical protein EVAR_79359_1 [Eumeta japonica]|uniref:Uncharacterized protein n=1 Tax=Eumeta variegata TaxID=151549 RepID=A0A4C1TET7_EUMVA|nr:hypothetical protein EVAR_79359_1 [Eumeta japonica]